MTGLIDVSISELTAMATKAARGAGFDWGMADEAARATCWLAARDLPGTKALADLLDQLDGKTLSEFAPVIGGGEWTARGGWLCPVTTGAAMLDRAEVLTASPLRLGPTLCPLLVFPAVAEVWPGGAIAEPCDLTSTRTDAVSIKVGSGLPSTPTSRAQVPQAIWDSLSTYANRTYAPATEASRLAGAGAGLSDND